MEVSNSFKFEEFPRLSVDLFCIIDAKTERFLFFNPAWCDVLGFTSEELRNCRPLDLIHIDDHENSIKLLTGPLRRGDKVGGFENRLLRKDGRILSFMWTAQKDKNSELFLVPLDFT